MKEEQLKKIIKKSTIETSDDFINDLMVSIKKSQEVEEKYFWWSFKPVLIACAILVLTLTFFLFKLLSADTSFLNPIVSVHKTPIFIVITLIFLYYINSIIKLNKMRTRSNVV